MGHVPAAGTTQPQCARTSGSGTAQIFASSGCKGSDGVSPEVPLTLLGCPVEPGLSLSQASAPTGTCVLCRAAQGTVSIATAALAAEHGMGKALPPTL